MGGSLDKYSVDLGILSGEGGGAYGIPQSLSNTIVTRLQYRADRSNRIRIISAVAFGKLFGCFS